MNKKFDLNKDWQFSLAGVQNKNKSDVKFKKWYNALVPGTVYHNLINNKLIPDPFYADNELKLQWVAESEWNYRIKFNYPEGFSDAIPTHLVFEGLDTVAEIFLNGESIGTTSNMFVKYEFEISKLLKKKNILEVKFQSPYQYAQSLEKQHGKLPVALNSERVYIRKAQYSFGWDWGPSFADIGIWKPVFLLQKESNNIENFTFNTVEANIKKAIVEVNLNFTKELEDGQAVNVNISDDDNSFDFKLTHNNGKFINEKIEIPNPKLWYPNGEGEQHLYNITISLSKDGNIEDKYEKRIGLRTINLQLKEDDKNTFRFIVNGKKIFAKGTNWIPADSFITRIEDEKYQAFLTLAKNANMNFIRVWGGGFYEQDKFYELCDELGLLVWQDFMFACAAYPEYDEFISNVTEEVTQNIYRLQHHPSLAIWCGNNENEWIWYQEQKTSYKQMPGYKIYADLIPGILKDIDPGRPYWESSPFGYDEDPNSTSSGNRHQWDLWSRWIDYKTVTNDTSLFVTEFGFQGPANQSTFEKVIPKDERNPQSYLFEFHNKQEEGNERQIKFLSGHLPVRTEWSDFIYLAQLSQGLALKACLEQWRFNYPHTNGSIIWQLNDCWPVSSWALIDSDIKPKLSYYMVKQAFNKQILFFERDNKNVNVVFVGDGKNSFKGQVIIQEVNLDRQKINTLKKSRINTSEKEIVHSLSIRENLRTGKSILLASLYDAEKNLVFRTLLNIPEWKYLRLPASKIKSKFIKSKKGNYISLKTDKPAFYVSLYNEEMILDNNCFTILPGEELFVPVILNPESKKNNFNVFSLNNYLSK